MTATEELDRAQLGRLREALARVPACDRTAWLAAWLDGARADQGRAAAARLHCADLLEAPPAPAGSTVAPHQALSTWEDYRKTPGGWRDLERLSAENPAEFKRLHDEHKARATHSFAI